MPSDKVVLDSASIQIQDSVQHHAFCFYNVVEDSDDTQVMHIDVYPQLQSNHVVQQLLFAF
jgi:hypothetical protein